MEREWELLNDETIRCLKDMGFPEALITNVIKETEVSFSFRIWIIDNSGSMMTCDGGRLISTKNRNDVRVARCTRWEELKECVEFHAQMGALLQATTKFKLLNAPSSGFQPEYGVFEMGADMVEQEIGALRHALSWMQPTGVTPLTTQVNCLYDTVSTLEESIRRDGKRVAIVIATDGIPTDLRGWTSPSIQQEFAEALQKLQRLPVWLVIRLCTNEDHVVKYYENLDATLELDLEVLDDFPGEAREVNRHNPWLNYGLPLHRVREMGFSNKLLDLLDERALTLDEVKEFLKLLLDGAPEAWPDPHVEWDDFVNAVRRVAVTREMHQYDPLKRKVLPWINLRQLERLYGPKRNQCNASLLLLIVVAVAAFLVGQLLMQ